MTTFSKWLILAVLLSAVALWWGINKYLNLRHQSQGEVKTSPVLDYTGSLDASQSSVHVRVFRIEKLSTGVTDTKSIFQNRIKLDSSSHHVELVWPDDAPAPFAASNAAVEDLDGDGKKELVLYDGDNVRVVTYEEGNLRFRSESDALDCRVYKVGPLKLNGDKVFICGVPFPNRENNVNVFVPRLFDWTRIRGFADVSKSHADFYRTNLLPDLQGRMTAEEDLSRRELYRAAIQQFRNELRTN